MAKQQFFRKESQNLQIPEEKRWTVIGSDHRRIYLPSPQGLDEEGASDLAARISGGRAVPVAALDRFGKLVPQLLDSATLSARAEEE